MKVSRIPPLPGFRICFFVIVFFLIAGQSIVFALSSSVLSEGGAGGDRRSDRFPLSLEDGKTYLVDASKQPFLVHGEAAWSLMANLTREDAEYYFVDRQQRGFNTVLVNLIERRFARNAPRNAYGDAPFLAERDFSQPNEKYFENVDWMLKKAADHGFLVLLTPAYLGFGGSDEGWYGEMQNSGAENLRKYGEFLGMRYQGFKNIVWVHGGDFNPPDRTLVNAIAEGIRVYDRRSLHTAHCAPETMASDYWKSTNWFFPNRKLSDLSENANPLDFFKSADWLDFNTLYTLKPVYLQGRKAWKHRAWPYILIESAYEFENAADEHRVRMQAYQALLTGAAGHVFGNNPIWHFEGPGLHEAPMTWKEALDSPGSRSMTYLVKLFGQIDWWKLEPDVGGRMILDGRGPENSQAVAALDKDRQFALLYVPDQRALEINPSLLNGPALQGLWYDPSTGDILPVRGFDRSERVRIETPGKNRSGEGDWVLLLKAAS